MKILADENCGATLVSALAAAGHDVKSIVRTQPGAGDEIVFDLACKEGRVLLTYDRDFGLLAEIASERPPAILLARLRKISSKARSQIIVQAIAGFGDALLGHLTVIEPHQIRSRPFKD
ncbi:MAG TPA: DUF5615 family PIN-like protein [Rhizomicrobium sp.]|jgi:predicted nuclease of predicted toxin-antitoxin system